MDCGDEGADDEEDGLIDEINEDALREMMYEEAHYNRGRPQGTKRRETNLRDEENEQIMLLGGDFNAKDPYDNDKEVLDLEKNMDNNILNEVMQSPLKRQKPNKVLRPRQAFKQLVDENL